jgi:hypothetical protein
MHIVISKKDVKTFFGHIYKPIPIVWNGLLFGIGISLGGVIVNYIIK